MKKYTRRELSNSIPFKTRFNRDSYMIFKEHYPDNFSVDGNGFMRIWKKRIGSEDNVQSILNKLGTNYTAYTDLVNMTLEKLNDDTINPTSIHGYNTIIDYLKSDRKFFDSMLPKLGEIIKATTFVGDKAEEQSEESIKYFFPGCEIIDSSGLGKITDLQGKDRKVIYNGKLYCIQIKIINDIYERDDKIIVEYLGARNYINIDYFIFKLYNN